MGMAIAASMVVWMVWGLTWSIAAIWTRPAVARAPTRQHLAYWALTLSGFYLLMHGVLSRSIRRYIGEDARQAVATDGPLPWVLFAMVLGGFLFALWARLHLGALWSGTITLKAAHRIVDDGPYGLVRHPIYTGLIAAALGLAALQASAAAFAGAALIAVGYWVKARVEEGFLRRAFDAQAYDAYRHRTPMLIPFLRAPGWRRVEPPRPAPEPPLAIPARRRPVSSG